jgi:hypothetical protein
MLCSVHFNCTQEITKFGIITIGTGWSDNVKVLFSAKKPGNCLPNWVQINWWVHYTDQIVRDIAVSSSVGNLYLVIE